MISQASEAAKRAGRQRNPKRKKGRTPFPINPADTKPLTRNASRACRALCGSAAKVQRNSLTPFRASSHFTEAHKSPAGDAGEPSKGFCLASWDFKLLQRQKQQTVLALSSKSCGSALAPASLSCRVKVVTKQNERNPTTSGLISKSYSSLPV